MGSGPRGEFDGFFSRGISGFWGSGSTQPAGRFSSLDERFEEPAQNVLLPDASPHCGSLPANLTGVPTAVNNLAAGLRTKREF